MSNNSDVKKIIGYYADGSAILEPKSGMIYTQAFIRCSNCGKTISAMGGPGIGAMCTDCYRYEFL